MRVVAGDSLRADQWPDLKVDLVVCDPPAGVTEWGREELLLDSRWGLGTPSKAEGELAWLQHAYAHTAPGGQVLMVMPASVAYRKAGRRIRAELVRRGIVRQVIALPPGTATSHALSVHLWCLRRPMNTGAGDTNHTVRMVDLTDNDPEASLEPRPDQVADVPLIELLDDVVDLTPGNHMRCTATTPVSTPRCARIWRGSWAGSPLCCPSSRPVTGLGALDAATAGVGGLALRRAGRLRGDRAGVDQRSARHGLSAAASCAVRSTRAGPPAPAAPTVARQGRARSPHGDRRPAPLRIGLPGPSEFEEGIRKVHELSRRLADIAREGLTTGALTPEN
ncbi:hypothetical protein SALBM217S_08820 [Streptomyces griseoloalbus]